MLEWHRHLKKLAALAYQIDQFKRAEAMRRHILTLDPASVQSGNFYRKKFGVTLRQFPLLDASGNPKK